MAESNEWKFGFGVLVLLCFCLFGVLCFCFGGIFGLFYAFFFFFSNGVYLQIPEKKKNRRHPNHRGAVEILQYLTLLRWELKHFWTYSLQACSHWALFCNDLNGLCSLSLVTSLELLSLSWSSIPLLWGILICILVIKVKLKANSHTFPWLFLLFTNCIVWNIIAVSKMGLVSLGYVCSWRPLILFCPHEMSMGWPAAAWSKITFIQQNKIVLPRFPSRLERLQVLVLIMANCHYDLSLSSGARSHFGPCSVPCLML